MTPSSTDFAFNRCPSRANETCFAATFAYNKSTIFSSVLNTVREVSNFIFCKSSSLANCLRSTSTGTVSTRIHSLSTPASLNRFIYRETFSSNSPSSHKTYKPRSADLSSFLKPFRLITIFLDGHSIRVNVPIELAGTVSLRHNCDSAIAANGYASATEWALSSHYPPTLLSSYLSSIFLRYLNNRRPSISLVFFPSHE